MNDNERRSVVAELIGTLRSVHDVVNCESCAALLTRATALLDEAVTTCPHERVIEAAEAIVAWMNENLDEQLTGEELTKMTDLIDAYEAAKGER